MKKYLFGTLLISAFAFGQSDNPFLRSERAAYEAELQAEDYPPDNPEPVDPVPIDNYVPILAIGAALLTLAAARRRQKTT